MPRTRILAGVALSALALVPATAAAHQGDPNSRSTITSITPRIPGVTLEVLDYDDSFELINRSRQGAVRAGLCAAGVGVVAVLERARRRGRARRRAPAWGRPWTSGSSARWPGRTRGGSSCSSSSPGRRSRAAWPLLRRVAPSRCSASPSVGCLTVP